MSPASLAGSGRGPSPRPSRCPPRGPAPRPSWPPVLALASDGKEDYEAGLDVVRRQMERGAWVEARTSLVALVEAHERAPCVLEDRAELVELLTTACFREKYGDPGPEAVFTGELASYRPSGRLELRYHRSQLGDFLGDRSRGALESGTFRADLATTPLGHPMVFSGEYSVLVEFASYPEHDIPRAFVCLGTEIPVRIQFGRAKQNEEADLFQKDRIEWYPARIEVFDPETKRYELGGEEDGGLPEAGKQVELKLTVRSTSVSVYVNGRKTASARRKKVGFGRFALVNCGGPQVREIRVIGQVDEAWLAERLAQHARDARTAFERTFHPKRHFPDWLVGD